MKVKFYNETQATNLILKRKNNFQSLIFVFDEENKKENFLILDDYIEDYINVLKFYGKKINNNTNEPIFEDFSINNILNIINNLTKFIKLPNDEKLKYIREVENIDFNLENFILQVTLASYKKKDIDIWKNKFSFLEELLFNMEKSEILKNTNKYIYFFETYTFHYSGVKAEENGSAGRSYIYFDENHRKLVKNNDLNEKNLILPTNKALKLYKEINSVEKKLFLLKDKNKSEERLKFLCSDEYKQIEEKKLKLELLKGNCLFYFPNYSYFEIKNKKSEEYTNLIYKKKERTSIKNGQENYRHINFHYSFN